LGVNPPPGAGLGVIPSADYVGPAPSSGRRNDPSPVAAAPAAPRRPAPAPGPARTTRSREDRTSLADMPTPAGFVRSSSRHFTVFAEQYPASERFLELIESLHSNLMLDLAPFTPWASSERTTIFLFKNQDTYRRVTGRPVWSGGASSVGKRKLYVYESEELPGIVAHELTHIYFDGFFLDGITDPLWLSEGMATLVQVERGLAAPNWLRENLERLERGEGFPIEDLTAVTSTAGWPDAKVRLWYAQSYSLVRFLIRTQYRSSFYKFAAHLRDGRPAPEALYRAYGAPYTRMVALEHAWRYELSRAQMAKLGAR
ncbi:MAG: basic secretory family protein, partial [Elusimicrobia bacterium]|nr:basic secretory family protein [Elusimicrobiota bacterium]